MCDDASLMTGIAPGTIVCNVLSAILCDYNNFIKLLGQLSSEVVVMVRVLISF